MRRSLVIMSRPLEQLSSAQLRIGLVLLQNNNPPPQDIHGTGFILGRHRPDLALHRT